MTTFERYICWNDEAVLAATPRDAASLAPAQFKAVHHPLRLLRRPLGRRTGGTWATEGELAEVLAGPVRPDGYLLIPVVGGAGTGKSHLVRWVHDATVGAPNWEVRYLAKNRTSIRRVIQIVIEGQEGEAFDRAREALDTAPAQTEGIATLAERLLDELALIVSEPVDHAEGVDAGQRQLVDKLSRELPDVLRDPVVRRRFIAEGGVIQRLVGLAREGRRDGDGLDDDAIRIAAGDLPLAFEELADASKGARDLLGKLASLTKLRNGAVELINAALPVAVKRVFISGQIDMIEVLREVRRTLHDQGRELVLFIEDLTVLHGVESEFLDALVEPAASPEGRLCNLRVLFAVTEHHFDGLDTVRSRCEDAYWLDAPRGDDGIATDEVISFLGRYLNVARLDAKLPADHPVANACGSCLHQAVCHPTFAASKEGYGLYPFDPSAIERLVAAISPDRFDPREVVRTLVSRFLLTSRSELQRHSYPSNELMEPFDRATEPLDPLFTARLNTDRPGDHVQVGNLARYWADDPPLVSDDILSAFGLSALDRSGLAPPRGRSTTVRAPSGPKGPAPDDPEKAAGPEARLSGANRTAYLALPLWASGSKTLSVNVTRTVRNLVHDVVLKNLDDGALPINGGPAFREERFQAAHIHVAGSDTSQNNTEAEVRIVPSPEVATALQGLILLSEGITDPATDQLRPFAATQTERWVDAAERHLTAQYSDPSLVAAVEGLTLGALVQGRVQVDDDPAKVLAQLFQQQAPPDPTVTAGRSAKWTKLLESTAAAFPELHRKVLLTFGESRGTGGVRAIHADLLLPMIAGFTKEWRFESGDPGIDKVMRLVPAAVEAEWDALRGRVEVVMPYVESERPWHDQAAKALEVLSEAARAGRLPDGEAIGALSNMRDRSSERAQRSVAKAHELVATDPALLERLALLTSAVPDDLTAVADFVVRANAALDGLESEVSGQRATAPGEGQLAGVIDLVLDGTDALLSAAEELAK